MTNDTAPITKADLLQVMADFWRDLEPLLERFGDRLDQRMPSDGPAWTGRQLFAHMLGSLQSNPYYLMQPREDAPLEGVIGDPYWRQIYATATLASFRAMLYASHTGTVKLVESFEDGDLQRGSGNHAMDPLGVLHFNYHVHLRSHIDDLRHWIDGGAAE